MTRRATVAVMVLAVAVAACLSPPAVNRKTTPSAPAEMEGEDWYRSPSPSRCDVGGFRIGTPFNGTGRFLLEPDPPRLEPGVNTTFVVSFHNPDCHTVVFGGGSCFDDPLVIGVPPLQFNARLTGFPLASWSDEFCSMPSGGAVVPEGHEYRQSFRWDGSVRLYQHTLVERGLGWQETTLWVAPGEWPAKYGFRWGPYPTQTNTTMIVRENQLNRGSPLHWNGCTDASIPRRWPAANATRVEMTTSTRAARLGTPITVWANYTIPLPPTGCMILDGRPNVLATRAGAFSFADLDGVCVDASPSLILVHGKGPTVTGRLRYTYDGLGPPGDACAPAGTPGEESIGLFMPSGGSKPLATRNVTWLPP